MGSGAKGFDHEKVNMRGSPERRLRLKIHEEEGSISSRQLHAKKGKF